MLYRTYRYSQWDGTQRIFDIDADELMDLLSEEMLKIRCVPYHREALF